MNIQFYSKNEPYYEFSNLYPAEISVDGIKYPSTEYYYRAQQFMGPNATPADLAYAEQIRSVDTANKAWHLSKQITYVSHAGYQVSQTNKTLLNDIIKQSKKDGVNIRADWNIIKDNVMRKAIWAKFTQHQQLRTLLINTGDAYITENSPVDSYWGFGRSETGPRAKLGGNSNGMNMLGKIIMEVRTFLTGRFSTPPTLASNWVVPEFILASAYPGAADINEHTKVVDALIQTPVNMIVSLLEPSEEKLNSYREVIAPGFKPTTDAFCNIIASARYNKNIALIRIPWQPEQSAGPLSDEFLDVLADMFAKAIGKHFKLLIHCLDGSGRTGTLIAVMLGKMYGMSADQALTILSNSFKLRVLQPNVFLPRLQTKALIAQIERLLPTPERAHVADVKPEFPYWSKTLPSPQEMFYNIIHQSLTIVKDKGDPVLVRKYPQDSRRADAISNYYTEDVRIDCQMGTNIIPRQAWDQIKTGNLKGKTAEELREEVYSTTRECNIFNPTYAKWIIESIAGTNATVLDPSSGWGDRLIGALAAKATLYVGYDPNPRLQKGYTQIVNDFGNNQHKKYHVNPIPFENANVKENYYDIAFTSPPYFALETYVLPGGEGEELQSIYKYPDYNAWVDNMYRPYLSNMYKAVKNSGHIVLYIEDMYYKGKKYPLRQLTLTIMEELGAQYTRSLGIKTFAEKSKYAKVRWALVWQK